MVIALCRKPVSADLDDYGEEDREELNQDQVINNSGVIEYTKNSLNQIYHVEEVLSMIDISGDGNYSNVGGQGGGMSDHGMGASQFN